MFKVIGGTGEKLNRKNAMISCLKNINKGSKQCRMFKIPKSHVHLRGKMSYVRYNVSCLRDNKKKIGLFSTNRYNT